MPASDLTVGTEVEYPQVQSSYEVTTLSRRAAGSHGLRSTVRSDYGGSGGWPDGNIGSDPTAGIELRSDPMSTDDLRDWYRMSIAELSKYSPHEPCGVSVSGDRASTIGLHLHFSGDMFEGSDGRRKGEALYELSQEPWFKLFACSSIADDPGSKTYQVFRSSYCSMNYTDHSSNSVVNRVNDDHFEWRLLEPVTPDHFDLVLDFFEIFADEGIDEARDFARGLVDDFDHRLTAVKRAHALGIEDMLDERRGSSETTQEDFDIVRGTPANRRLDNPEAQGFYNEVYNASNAPYIYVVEDQASGDNYIAMYSENYSESDNPFEFNGVQFQFDDVLDARDLSDVTTAQADAVYDAVGEYRNGGRQSNNVQKSPATNALLDRCEQILKDN